MRHTILRAVVGGALALCVACSADARADSRIEAPAHGATAAAAYSAPPIPAELIGRWSTGPEVAEQWVYELSPDGRYRAGPAQPADAQPAEGTFAVFGATITFSNNGRPATVNWSLADGVLTVNGVAYVRA